MAATKKAASRRFHSPSTTEATEQGGWVVLQSTPTSRNLAVLRNGCEQKGHTERTTTGTTTITPHKKNSNYNNNNSNSNYNRNNSDCNGNTNTRNSNKNNNSNNCNTNERSSKKSGKNHNNSTSNNNSSICKNGGRKQLSSVRRLPCATGSATKHPIQLTLCLCINATSMAMAPTDTPLQNTPLPELVGGSAGFGRWMLKVVGHPKEKEYSYKWDGKTNHGKSFTVLLVSEDTTQYCYGKFTRRGREPKATADFKKAKETFHDGSVWLVTKAALAREKPLYIGSSVKAVIDLNASTTAAVLQSTAYSQLVPTPAEDLATLLEATDSQRVDVTALVVKVSETRAHTTIRGPRLIVDVTIRDASGPTGASQCEFAMFFPDSQEGRHHLDEFRQCQKDGAPVAFFNLCIHMSDTGRNTMKPHSEEFNWQVACAGERAAALTTQAQVLQSTEQARCIAEIPTFVAHDKVDYMSPEATLTVARLLREVIRAQQEFPATDSSHLFQLNHVRIREPSVGENVLTSDGNRLFVPVRLQDHTGEVELRMREKAALEFSGLSDRDSFCDEVRTAGLNFPILASVRVALRKNGGTPDSQDSQASLTEQPISAVVVEAMEQPVDCAKSIPNASMNYVNHCLQHFGTRAPDRMLVAPANALKHSPHGGLIVEDADGARQACGSVLTLLAHVGKCSVVDLEAGHRIATAKTWNIPFDPNLVSADGAPEHADAELNAQFVSYCTMSNVQYYTLSSRKGQLPTYAMVVVGSSHVTGGVTTFMIDKVQTLASTDIGATQRLFAKLSLLGKKASIAMDASSKSPKPSSDCDITPFKAKKARRLTLSPTDASIE